MFAAFCIFTYSDRKISFSERQLNDYINRAIELECIEVESHKFFKDLVESVCIIQKDGEDYTFTYRSFQEYFSAYFISRSQSVDFAILLDSIVKEYYSDSVLGMLFGLNREQVEINWVLPKLKELVSLCETTFAEEGAIALLKIFFDRITFYNDAIGFGLAIYNVEGSFLILLDSRALKSRHFVDFQPNHAASRPSLSAFCALIEPIFSESKDFE